MLIEQDRVAVRIDDHEARGPRARLVGRVHDLEQRALDWLYLTWLPSSGRTPAHQPGFEAWNGRSFAHGFEHFEIRLQLPVVDAGVPL